MNKVLRVAKLCPVSTIHSNVGMLGFHQYILAKKFETQYQGKIVRDVQSFL